MFIIHSKIIGYYLNGGGWSERGIGAIKLYNSKKEANNDLEELKKIYNVEMEAKEVIGVICGE